MEINLDNTSTSLKISEDVVITIVGEAVKELQGVYSLSNLPVKMSLLATPSSSKPVRMELLSDSAHIDVGIIVNMNYKIKDVAEQVQTSIKAAVQDMTGITISKVNVFVTGVHLKDENE